MKNHFDTEVSTNNAEILMLLCFLISGFVGSTTCSGEQRTKAFVFDQFLDELIPLGG